MKKRICLFCSMVLLACSSCGDFLEEFSHDLVYANDCKDLDEVMIGNAYMAVKRTNLYSFIPAEHYYPFLYLMDDDVEENVIGPVKLEVVGTAGRVGQYRNLYSWQKRPFTNILGEAYKDEDMGKLYKHVAVVNVVLSQIAEYKDAPEELRNRLLGECHFLRGAYYFLLVNMYGLPYSENTADKDLGVPLKLNEIIGSQYFARNTVKEVYEQIVRDLVKGADYLKGVEQPTYYRVNEKAARILLSRVHLYMGKWQLALDEVNKALALDCPLRNLRSEVKVPPRKNYKNDNTWLKAREYLHDVNSREILFTMGTSTLPRLVTSGSECAVYKISQELVNLYAGDGNTEDLRLEKYIGITPASGGAFLCYKSCPNTQSRIVAFEAYLIRSSEAYLNKAEAEAMSDQEGEARITLNNFMEHRYAEGKLPQIDGLTGEKLVNFIRDERRKELSFECHRWFDLRRYAVSPKYPLKTTIRHAVYTAAASPSQPGSQIGYYELKPYGEDKAWVLPFPEQELVFNDGLLLDNLRDEREIIK